MVLFYGVFVFYIWFALGCVCICLLVCPKVCLYLSRGLLYGVFVFSLGLLYGVFVFVFWLALMCVCILISWIALCCVCICLLV